MKIVMGKTGDSARVYTDDGVDITVDLCIAKLEIIASPGELTIANFTCYPESVIIDDLGEVSNTKFLDLVKIKPPSYKSPFYTPINPCSEIELSDIQPSPEATLEMFKIKPISSETH